MATRTVGLSTHIWNNNAKCIMLLLLYPALIFAVFWLIIFVFGYLTNPNINQATLTNRPTTSPLEMAGATTLEYAPIILAVVAIWFTLAWFMHSRMVRKLSHSHPVSRQEEPELYNLMENLCIAQGMTMPRLEIIETHARNAFASGLTEKDFTVTVTRGLMNSLTKDELEAVIAHELVHIQNRDVRLLIVTIIFTGIFGFLAQMMWSKLRMSLFYSGFNRQRNGNGGIIAILIIAAILWLGYLASLLMRFALSRRREYMADAGAVEMTKNPDAMMRALMRISGKARIPETTDDIALMCIENGKPFMGMFATHPPITKRIRALSQATGTAVPDVNSLPAIGRERSFTATCSTHKRPQNPWLIRQRRT